MNTHFLAIFFIEIDSCSETQLLLELLKEIYNPPFFSDKSRVCNINGKNEDLLAIVLLLLQDILNKLNVFLFCETW